MLFQRGSKFADTPFAEAPAIQGWSGDQLPGEPSTPHLPLLKSLKPQTGWRARDVLFVALANGHAQPGRARDALFVALANGHAQPGRARNALFVALANGHAQPGPARDILFANGRAQPGRACNVLICSTC